MTDEPIEIDANQSADPIGPSDSAVPDASQLPEMLDAIPSNVVEREYDASAIQVLEG
ncbi:MAG: hypothetical protein HOV67_03770, partial [Kribbellaceae bacterium]|nr:hypothetical protein [Kribbellaceae bacterium]